jgi:uncharacterized paraquat-inducible protein A|tara:strand:- start:602 stop:832 length:231 start_codon:yes stop_codon:yes gene_type:complete
MESYDKKLAEAKAKGIALAQELMSVAKGETSTLAEERMRICKPCEFYSRWGRCTRCGCILAAKTRIPSMKCPVGKW